MPPARVHHLDCCTMCPLGGRLFWGHPGHLVGHVLLLETASDGLILVDTGVGLDDVADRARRLGPVAVLGGFPTDPRRTARRQIEALGFDPADVRHIVLTHFDLDHAGGIPDFPGATVHLLDAELRAAKDPPTFAESQRYRRPHVEAMGRWEAYPADGESWHGFPAAQRLRGLSTDVLLVPLQGHSRGHACVAVEGEDGWMLHAGDAYFHRAAVTGGRPPLGHRVFERLAAHDPARVRDNHARLAEVIAEGSLDVFCAHDPQELPA